MESLGLIGHPVEHSLSKIMQNSAFKEMGLDYEYKLFNIPREKLAIAVEGIRLFGLRGVNVTVPHKTEVMQYLDEITETATLCEAVNTIVNDNGKLKGYNTDFDGFKEALHFHNFNVAGRTILVLGAGGAARAIVAALKDMKAAKIIIANRTLEKAEQLASHFQNAKAINMDVAVLKESLNASHAVINTTTLGMYPNINNSPIFKAEDLANISFVYDIVYNPAKTTLLLEAEKAGCGFANGMEMLIRQGAKSFSLWTECQAPIDTMRKSLLLEETK